jgi:protocatechuate 3,4-dioxygenase beta subunit
MRRPVWLLLVVAVGGLLLAPGSLGRATAACAPTLQDGFGPFGRGMPPMRAKIGSGHVLTGVVLSALDCRPLRGAQVQFWQSNKNGRYTTAGSATVITDRAGQFRFEGPVPTPYEGREGHIHIRVIAHGFKPLMTRYVPPRGSHRGSVRLVLEPEQL